MSKQAPVSGKQAPSYGRGGPAPSYQAAPSYGRGGYAAPAYAPRLPSTGTGGLLSQQDEASGSVPIVTGLLALVGAAASAITFRRRRSA